MMIARWHFKAKFGRKDEAISLFKEWNEQIGVQTDIDVTKSRTVTGSVGANEALVENEFEIQGLADLQSFYDKISSIKMHKEWSRKMGEVIVSGSTYWQVYRLVH